VSDYEPRCSEHPKEVAGWRCTGCGKHLCGECTARLLNTFFCAHCEAPATQLTEPRVEKPFSVWLTDALMFPLRAWPALLGATIAILVAGSAEGGAFAWIGRVVVPVVAVGFGLAMLTMGARRDTTALGRSMLRVVATTAILWIPGLLHLWLVGALTGELGALFVALVVAYLPVVLVSSATDVGLASTLNPFAVFDWLWRIKARYVVYFTSASVLLGAGFAASRGEWQLSSMGFVNDGARIAASLALLAMGARLLGTLAHVHGDAFDWGRPESYVDPLYPDLQARAARKSLIRDADKMRSDGNGDNSLISPEQQEARAAREIVECIRADRMRRALKLYLERDTWADDRFDDRELMALGTAANMAKNYDVAVNLLERAAEAKGRAGARALYSLARIHAGALDDAARARELYQRVIDDYPESDVARLARTELEK